MNQTSQNYAPPIVVPNIRPQPTQPLRPALYSAPRNIVNQPQGATQEQQPLSLAWFIQLDHSIQQALQQCERSIQQALQQALQQCERSIQNEILYWKNTTTVAQSTNWHLNEKNEELQRELEVVRVERERVKRELCSNIRVAEENKRLGREVGELKEQNRVLNEAGLSKTMSSVSEAISTIATVSNGVLTSSLHPGIVHPQYRIIPLSTRHQGERERHAPPHLRQRGRR
jgi:hypothetical protein